MGKWIDRQLYMIDFTLSSLLRRRGKNLALISIYTLIVFILASVIFYGQALREEAAAVLKGAPEMIVQRMAAGRHDLIPARYIDKIRTIRGVNSVKGRLWGYYYDPVTGANYTLMVDPETGLKPGDITIGEGVARTRLAYPGDSLEFRTHQGEVIEFQVRKTLTSASALVSSDLILLSEPDFRRVFGTAPGSFTDLVLAVKNPRELRTIAVKIATALPDTRQILRDEILRTYDAVFNWRGGIVILIFIGAILAFVILAWEKASGLSVEEKKEIGLLKAIGWETADVIAMKFWEGGAISFLSFGIGIILAYIHVFFSDAFLLQPVLKGWAVLYPQFKLMPTISVSQVAVLFLLTVAPYTLAVIVPSWRTATIDPDSVMR